MNNVTIDGLIERVSKVENKDMNFVHDKTVNEDAKINKYICT